MLFLVVYDPSIEKIVDFRRYQAEDTAQAFADRRKCERQYGEGGSNLEIVLLEANSEEDAQKTHSRYFQNFKEYVEQQAQSLKDLNHQGPISG